MDEFNKHAQTVIQIIIATLLIWVGYSTVSLRESVIRLETRHEQSLREIADLRQDVYAVRNQLIAAATAATAAATAAAAAATARK